MPFVQTIVVVGMFSLCVGFYISSQQQRGSALELHAPDISAIYAVDENARDAAAQLSSSELAMRSSFWKPKRQTARLAGADAGGGEIVIESGNLPIAIA
ncbi:MAG: hypothetical protein JO249_00570 [Acidobacteria bacterium]|nr:hypothetical protein [Acidobacteriota bacterium]